MLLLETKPKLFPPENVYFSDQTISTSVSFLVQGVFACSPCQSFSQQCTQRWNKDFNSQVHTIIKNKNPCIPQIVSAFSRMGQKWARCHCFCFLQNGLDATVFLSKLTAESSRTSLLQQKAKFMCYQTLIKLLTMFQGVGLLCINMNMQEYAEYSQTMEH